MKPMSVSVVTVPELAPGERLCLTTDRALSLEQLERIKRHFASAMAVGKTIVLDDGLRFSVMPPNTVSLNADYSARFGDAG